MNQSRTSWPFVPPPREDGESLQRWLYRSIREQIIGGQLAPGSPVPSSRRMAEHLNVARGTVVLAYEQLVTEGYLNARPGAGMQVSEDIPDRMLLSSSKVPKAAVGTVPRRPPPSSPFLHNNIRPVAFAPHRCETRQLPIDVLRQLQSRVLRSSNGWLFEDGQPQGLLRLRRSVASYLAQARGLTVSPERVVIVSSMQQALDTAIRVLTRPGDSVWTEDPGYPGVRRLLEHAGRRPVFVPVDQNGICVKQGIEQSPRSPMVCVSACRQAPLGVPLSLPRRAALLEWADKAGSMIFEDDYDSEYRFGSRPVPPLAAADTSRVLLAGTFSKLLYPGLRLAYAVCPEHLVEAFTASLSLTARHPNLLVQAVLADFIEEGHLARHVRKMRRIYGERAEAFTEAARTHWAGLLEVSALQAGLDVTARLVSGHSDLEAASLLHGAGISAVPLSAYSVKNSLPPALVLGFAAVDAAELTSATEGVRRVLSSQSVKTRRSP